MDKNENSENKSAQTNDVAEEPQTKITDENAENIKEENKKVEQPLNDDKSELDEILKQTKQQASDVFEEQFKQHVEGLNKQISELKDAVSKITLKSGAAIHEDNIDVESVENSYQSNYQSKNINDLDLN